MCFAPCKYGKKGRNSRVAQTPHPVQIQAPRTEASAYRILLRASKDWQAGGPNPEAQVVSALNPRISPYGPFYSCHPKEVAQHKSLTQKALDATAAPGQQGARSPSAQCVHRHPIETRYRAFSLNRTAASHQAVAAATITPSNPGQSTETGESRLVLPSPSSTHCSQPTIREN